MANQQRMQTAMDYDQGISFLEKVGAFLRGLDGGGGDYTDWDVSRSWQIYDPFSAKFATSSFTISSLELPYNIRLKKGCC
jgi:hypothetical protein